MTLTGQRRSIRPSGDDTWESIAARELSDIDVAEAAQLLQSWNMHVFMRPLPPEGSPREGNRLLPSDVIFLEAPRA